MINYKRIDTTVIVVLEGRILSRVLPEGQEGDDINNKIIDTIQILNNNNSALTDEDFLSGKSELIRLMIPPVPKKQTEVDFKPNEVDIDEQIESMAFKDIDESKRIADISGQFEYDEVGHVYLKGFSIPIPEALANALLDAHYNPESKYTVNSLINFWQWVVPNPNKQARIDLFGWFDTGEFVITEGGAIVAYRNVAVKTIGVNKDLQDFVNEMYTKVKRQKQSAIKYLVTRLDDDLYLHNLKNGTKLKGDVVGNLNVLHNDVNDGEGATVYTDNYTKSMVIKMGEEVSMPREECNENHNVSCSSGLHFMSPAYSMRLGDTTVVVLVNPYNIVAFPSYDNTKGRCCAYLPISKAEIKNGKIITLDSGSYDLEYAKYNSEALATLLREGDLQSLKDKGLIADDLTEGDLGIIKSHVEAIISKRVIDVT